MSIIANDLSRFNQDISDYHISEQELNRNFEQLITHMRELNSMWEGEAHEQLMQTFSVDQNQAQAMVDHIREVYNELIFAHSEYSNCESTVAGIIDSIPV